MGYFSELDRRLQHSHTDQYTDRGKALFGPGAEMRIPTEPPAPASHLTGEYPQEKQPHRCNTYWHAKVNEAGQVMSMGKARYEAWRRIITKSGKLLHCPLCWHERVKGFCEPIERIGLLYRDWETLRYTIVANSDYSALQARRRKHNQRARERGEPEINIVGFPKETITIVLHDAPADWLEGDPLPTERPLLYALVSDWARTPKGKRAGRGLGTWGEPQAESKSKRKGRNQDQGDDDTPTVAARIYGPNYPKVALLVSRYLDIDANLKGMKFNGFDASEFVDLLDAAGVDYVIDGEIKGVTDKTNTPEHTSLKRDALRQPDLLTDEPEGHEGAKSNGPPVPRPINWGALA